MMRRGLDESEIRGTAAEFRERLLVEARIPFDVQWKRRIQFQKSR